MEKITALFFILFNFGVINAQYTAIPDTNFELELINQGIDTNSTIDGQVLTSAINTITILAMNNSNVAANIVNLAGIEGFTALQELNFFSAGSLQVINLNQNQYLKKLVLVNPQISNLNISNNLTLETLYLYYASQLATIDVSNNSDLKDLAIGNFNLAQLNISNNINLEKLRINYTQINQLDLTHNTALKYIYFGNIPITTINVNQNLLLEELRVYSCLITSIDVSQNINLKLLGTSTNTIQSIDVSQNTQLDTLYCINNQLTTINLSNNPLLNKILCNNYSGFPQNNLSSLYIQNGANSLLNGVYDIGSGSIPPTYNNRFDSTNNPSLHCIFVDDVANCNINWLGKDATSNYVSTQQECDNLNNETFIIDKEITIYPNPANEILNIKNNERIKNVTIYDILGKVVLEKNVDFEQINISNLISGLYLVKISTESETVVKKIIKE